LELKRIIRNTLAALIFILVFASCKTAPPLPGVVSPFGMIGDGADMYIYMPIEKNKKIAGILTEAMTSVETGLVTDVIIGLGINFSIADFPDDLKEKAGSLFMPPAPISRNELIAEIWKCFYESDPEELIYLYKQHSLVLGREVSFSQNNTDYKGLAKDVSDSGQLLVQLDNGQEIWLNSGEVSLSSW